MSSRGPAGLPLLGNAHQLMRASRVHTVCERWAGRGGPIVRVDIGRRRLVGISDADEIHRILRERPQGFRRWRDQEVVSREISMLAGESSAAGVFIAEGEDWKRQRRLVITALNTNHLHRYFHVIRTATERLHRRLARGGRGRSGAGDHQGADLLYRRCHLRAGVRAGPEHAGGGRG